MKTIDLKYPEHQFRIRSLGGRDQIFDNFRRAWVSLTPEEWVRQNLLQYMVQEMRYPRALISVEKEIWIGSLRKRFDILVYDSKQQPWMLVECKSEQVELGEALLDQILRYSSVIICPYILISNGLYTIGWERIQGTLKGLELFPEWDNY